VRVTNAPTSPLLLVLEAATAAGSVALFRAGELVGVRRVPMGVGREDQLFPAVQALLLEAKATPGALARIVCGAGPGSFTSLRIAASLAKGLAHGSGATLHAVPSLLLAAATATSVHDESPRTPPAGHYLVHSDALRGERYVQPVELGVHGWRATGPLARASEEQLVALAGPQARIAVAGGASSEAAATSDWRGVPQADALGRCVESVWASPVSLDAWEPAYGRLAEAQVKWEATHGVPLPRADAMSRSAD
jgi:tRNA threonylcarbamoyladenosine biosynthesis protein TsaB